MSASRLRPALALSLLSSLLLAACGGGTGSQYQGSIVNGRVLTGPQQSGDTSGGPVAGATVCSYAFVSGGAAYTINTAATPYGYNNTLAACTTTAADGSFSFNLLNGYYGPILIQASANTGVTPNTGSYTFNGNSYLLNPLTSTNLGLAANASNAFIASGTTLQAVVSVGGGGTVTTNVTPLTTFAVARSGPTTGFTYAAYQSNLLNVAQQLGINATDPNQLANAVPGAGSYGGAYGKAMLGVEQYLATMKPTGSNTDDPYGANLLNWTNLATVSADYTAAYNQVNGTSASFNFN